MIPFHCAQAAVIPVSAEAQVESRCPADLTRHISHTAHSAGRNADDRFKIDILLQQVVQRAFRINAAPGTAFQYKTAIRDLCRRCAGRYVRKSGICSDDFRCCSHSAFLPFSISFATLCFIPRKLIAQFLLEIPTGISSSKL